MESPLKRHIPRSSIHKRRLNLSLNTTWFTGFAVCQAGGAFVPGSDHVRITSANIFFNTAFNWFFNTDTVTQLALLAQIGNQAVDEERSASINLSATNPDGDTQTFSASGLPAFATLTDHGDGDGLSDATEAVLGTDPNNADSDGDGLADDAGGIVLLTRLATGIISTDALETVLADLNGDSRIDAADLLLLQQLLLAAP